ncbi:Histidine kinase-like ATPase domain-containing protein [Lentzea fradiae]|uniref:Histidine kinase-like ATPase domain-containing protein n=1 Tax=Lentzea fradiae TaxID=200378 RepID=A0A1G7QCG1_9PSEU|nr:ATP-binding protein [Lentzea fradiae]SDF96241.1 Histidine kinase-like ATPase domain-containing protein [Lentzea fradiae]
MTTGALTEAVFSLPEGDRGGGASLARDFARRVVLGCGYRGGLDDVVLVVDELVTNAVRHGGGCPVVRLTGAADRVLVEVADDGAARPVPRPGGWGLRLVAVLCTSWGVGERAGRKVVWGELTAR